MSLRRHVLRLVVLATAVAVCFSAFAGAASAKKKYSAKQKAAIRKQLKKQIKKNPAVIKRKSFVRRAALVNFVLPVTIRIRTGCKLLAYPQPGAGTCAAGGTALNEGGNNTAHVDLGPALGQRDIALDGSLAAEVQFTDSYDGGALGNVNVEILPSSTKKLSTSSVPLLWNQDVKTNSTTRTDVNFAKALVNNSVSFASSISAIAAGTQGCGDFTNAGPGYATDPSGVNSLYPYPTGTIGVGNYKDLFAGASPSLGGGFGGMPGYPVTDTSTTANPAYYLPFGFAGVDDPANLKTGYSLPDGVPSANDWVGPTQNPFPYAGGIAPASNGQYANAADTVLRTNALSLSIAPSGQQVNQLTGTSSAGTTGLTNGPEGTQSFITGKSGGQANLFGNIPGKSYSIDVTVNLATQINSIFRIVDQDIFSTPLLAGSPYPAGIFNCRQIWTGAVQNYLPGIRLGGNLRIAPAITKDGKLRIAKATVQSLQPAHLALSACLMPYEGYNAPNSAGYPTVTFAGVNGPAVPTLAESAGEYKAGVGGGNTMAVTSGKLPSKVYQEIGAPTSVKCNENPDPLVRNSGLAPVLSQIPAQQSNGYTTTASGAQATVAGDITVNGLSVDVLIGDA